VMSVVVVVLNRWESGQSVGFISIPVPTGFSNLLLSLVLVLILLRRPDGITRSRELPWPIRKQRVSRAAKDLQNGPGDRQDASAPDPIRGAAETGTDFGLGEGPTTAQDAASRHS